MEFFDFLKNKKSRVNYRKEDKTDEAKSKSQIGAGDAIKTSIKQSVSQSQIKYSRPAYNPQTRKQLYDDSSAHKNAMDSAFASGETVRDPYSGAELVQKQRDAKIQFGADWQSHAAEADHIDPLSQISKRTADNPFLTTDDIKEIGNSEDNFQILSRKLNQGSRGVGKGGSTQQEWADDTTRMEGLKDCIESGESIDNVKQRIRNTGKAAEKRNNIRALKRSGSNALKTGHEAGMNGAQKAGITALTMSGIMNIVSVIKGEKTGEEAVTDTIKDGGKAAVMGYTATGGMTIVSQTLSYSNSEFVKSLVENNVPGKVITAVIVTGDTLKKWGNGEITTQECLIQLGDKGLNMVTMEYSMAVGQALIPVPIVGGAVGALVGSMLTSSLYNNLIDELKTKQLEHEERLKVINACNEAAEQARTYREELESYLDSYFEDYKTCFDLAISSMKVAYEMGDADGVIASANDIARKLGEEVKYETVDEFKEFLDGDEDDVL